MNNEYTSGGWEATLYDSMIGQVVTNPPEPNLVRRQDNDRTVSHMYHIWPAD